MRVHQHANNSASNSFNRQLIRISALKAMKSAAGLESFNGGGVEKRIRLIWSSIISNSQEIGIIKVPASSVKGYLVKQGSQQSLGSSNFDQSIELESLDELAMQCLSTLLSQTNSTTIGVVLDVLFDYFDNEKSKWEDQELCVRLFGCLSESLQVPKFLLICVGVMYFTHKYMEYDL